MSTEPAVRRRLLLGGGLVAAIAIAVALALFQPWQLWVDTKVDDAAPAGAVVLTPSTRTTEAVLPVTPRSPVTDSVVEPPTTPASSTVAAFVSLDHATSGNASVLEAPDGTRYVRFEDFATENGPDVKVYLSANPADGPEQAFDDEFVNLGRLQGNLGAQNYAVPAEVDLSRYRSVVIWCDRFNSAFGAAPLT